MKKQIIKAIYDIAHANGVTVDVGADMFIHNLKLKNNINKGSDFDFTKDINSEIINNALDFAAKNYEKLVVAYANGGFDTAFEGEE